MDVGKESMGVWLRDEETYRLVFQAPVCPHAASSASCDDPLCSKTHFAEVALKVRNLVGFNRIQVVRIWAGLNDVMMSRIAKYLPFLKTFTSVDLTACSNRARPDATALYTVLENFEGLSHLSLRQLAQPFDWTVLRNPRMLKLEDLHISGLSTEPDTQEVVRYCRQPCSADPGADKRLRFTETPLGMDFVNGLCRVRERFVVI